MTMPATVDRICPHCGKKVARDRTRFCNNCGRPLVPEAFFDEARVQALVAGDPPAIVRTYRGKQQADAAMVFREEAEMLAGRGYTPTSQSWAVGQWGVGAFLVALLLSVFLVGILIFIYLLIVKPEGTLTVTYTRIVPQMSVSALEPSPPAALSERLAQLDAARAAGLISDEEHAAKRASILSQH